MVTINYGGNYGVIIVTPRTTSAPRAGLLTTTVYFGNHGAVVTLFFPFFLRRGRNWISHGNISSWNLLAPGILFWYLLAIYIWWIYIFFDSLAKRLLIDLPLIWLPFSWW